MKLYIGNTTRQNFEFLYRPYGSARIIQIQIPVGMQRLVYDGDHQVVDEIIAHFAIYGLIDIAKLDQTKTFIGHVYSVDSEIPESKMRRLIYAIEQNDDHADRRAQQVREETAAAQAVPKDHARVSTTSIEASNLPGSKEPAFNQRLTLAGENDRPSGRGKGKKAA